MIHIHTLGGCAPTPLAHYLKALGILRLVTEQRDPRARGFWRDERFHLVTALDRADLEAFFLVEYAPSPITSPWNKGAGFYAKNDRGISPLENSKAARFASLRAGFEAARSLIEEIGRADAAVRDIKSEAKVLPKAQRDRLRKDPVYKRRLAEAERIFAGHKANLIPRCRLVWHGAQRQWMDAAVVVGGDKPIYPALLGTGGNDGRLDFTNNYYQRLAELFDPETGTALDLTRSRVVAALWGTPERAMMAGATGQYLPGSAGGANSNNGPSGGALVNPVDFVLALEGAMLFTAHTTRRLDANADAHAAAPFHVRSGAAGYGSASSADEGPRGEQWMPLWDRPSLLREVQQLLAEGRTRLNGKSVKEPLDLARAIARLGIARGVVAFERYGYIERNGQSNLAVPLGQFHVPDAPPHALALLDNLDAWLGRLRRQARDDAAPARLRIAEARLSNALFDVVQHPDEPIRWQQVLLELAAVEAVLVSGSGTAAGPVPRLDTRWLDASDDNSAELRLALCFALQGLGMQGPAHRWDGVRRHWLPLERERFALTQEKRLLKKPDVVMNGRDGVTDAIAVVERRMVEAGQRGERHLGLRASKGASAALGDLAAAVAGDIDFQRTMCLARALLALDRRQWLREERALRGPTGAPDDAWVVLRLATLPWPLDRGVDPGTDPAIVRRLTAGDPSGAFELARRRLEAAGIRPTFRSCAVDPARGRLWAAALAFPISPRTARSLAQRVDPPTKGLTS